MKKDITYYAVNQLTIKEIEAELPSFKFISEGWYVGPENPDDTHDHALVIDSGQTTKNQLGGEDKLYNVYIFLEDSPKDFLQSLSNLPVHISNLTKEEMEKRYGPADLNLFNLKLSN